MDRLRASFSRRPQKYDKAIASSVAVRHVEPSAAAKPKRTTTLAAEYRDKILDALAPAPLSCAQLAVACDCHASNRTFIRARQALVAKGEVCATGAHCWSCSLERRVDDEARVDER